LDLAAIKRAYFALLTKHPPHQDQEGFRRIRAAYEALGTCGGAASFVLRQEPDPAVELPAYRERHDIALARAQKAATVDTEKASAGAHFAEGLPGKQAGRHPLLPHRVSFPPPRTSLQRHLRYHFPLEDSPMSNNELQAKEKILVGIGAAVAAGCRPCTRALLRAARATGACERSIRLAIESGLYAGTCATREMAAWAEAEQGAAPELDATFRTEKEKLTALVLAGAALAANSTELLGRYVGEAEALDFSKDEIEEALAAAHTVARTAAAKVESAAGRLGFTLKAVASAYCKDGEEAEASEPPAAGGCGCGKGTDCT
jgi:alkylhydroperoxidase/carboxymuconolactone decarboxylase family protein YurZ